VGAADFVRLLAGTAAGRHVPPARVLRFRWLHTNRRVVVLGLDGLDPTIVRALIDMGRAPNFKKLAEMGSFLPLGTTMPALSPVAWSSFITGLTPAATDRRLHRARPQDLLPRFLDLREPRSGHRARPRDLHLPVKGGGSGQLETWKAVLAYLTEQGIPSWVSRIRPNFPVDETATYAISGMGTPDLTDAYGMFSYYTSDPFETYPNVSAARSTTST